VNPDPAFEELRRWAVKKYKELDPSNLPTIGADPTYEECYGWADEPGLTA
jgi:hypothetical protein